MILTGIVSAKVNLEDKLGIFEYDPSVSAPDLIKDYVDEMGFEASLKHAAAINQNNAESSGGRVLTGTLDIRCLLKQPLVRNSANQ